MSRSNEWTRRCGHPAKMVASGAVLLLVLAVNPLLTLASQAAGADPAPSPTWTQQLPTSSPSPRVDGSLAFDTATNTSVLFGGLTSTASTLGDTWTWNGTFWTEQTPPISPPARSSAAMAYDTATGDVVLFGGSGQEQLNDTWTWNGISWTRQSPPTSPPPIFSASMAYDPATGTVVLFGGASNDYGGPIAQTWTWNGSTWTQLLPAASPVARVAGSMAFDPKTDNLVLFGGYENAPNGELNDTWVWDGANWSEEDPVSSPEPRDNAAMAFDSTTGALILFGGASHVALYGDTWAWDGTNWTQEHPTSSPPARYDPMMDSDPNSQGVLLFGGTSGQAKAPFFSDTWNFTMDSSPPAATPEVPSVPLLALAAVAVIGGAVWTRRSRHRLSQQSVETK